MRINSCTCSFGSLHRNIIDVQGHIGQMYDGMKNTNLSYSSQDIIDTVADFNVKKVLVSSLSGLNDSSSSLYKDEISANKELLEECRKADGKLFPLVTCQPGISQNTSNIEKVLSAGKFYGMKFHPTNTSKSISENFDIYSKYLSVAEKHGLPCVFHSVTDGKSNPTQIIRLAEQHKNLPVVLYHIDLGSNKQQYFNTIDRIAESVKSNKSNLFVDISWLTDIWSENTQKNKDVIKYTIEKLGVDRILFGSDTPITEMGDKNLYGNFVNFIHNTVKEYFVENSKESELEKSLDKIFYDNAEEVFFQKNWNKKPALIEKSNSNNLKLILLGATLLFGAGYFIFKTLNSKSKSNSATNDNLSKNQNSKLSLSV